MSIIVTAVFSSHFDAIEAAKRVKEAGLRTSDISILTNEDDSKSDNSMQGGVSRGLSTGGVLGGAAGLLLGLGTIAIPGLGVIAAAGPIAGLLSGAITGGVVGALVDLGIPKAKSNKYEQEIKRGNTIWSMQCDDSGVAQRVQSILEDSGAISSDIHK